MEATINVNKHKFCIAIHGGAGVIERGLLNAEQEEQIRQGLSEAVQAGLQVLTRESHICSCGKSDVDQCTCSLALDAVQAAVVSLENNPWFNAGKGAVFTYDGDHELDASIMEGSKRCCGAIAGVKHCKNPIIGARAVMERTEHVFLAGPDADRFLEQSGLETVENSWFDTDIRRNQWNSALSGNATGYTAPTRERKDDKEAGESNVKPTTNHADIGCMNEKKFGTVGAVAIDSYGNVAAATSTGGMTNKRFGRVGDTPVIGAGTWADNRTCAVSATGHGEFFIRHAVTHDIASRVKYLGETVDQACKEVVFGDLLEDGGEGGVIAVDPKTRTCSLIFNTAGMYRAWADETGSIKTGIYKDE